MTDVEKAKNNLMAAFRDCAQAEAMRVDQLFKDRYKVVYDAALEAYVRARIVESLQKQDLNHHVHGCECFCPDPFGDSDGKMSK